MAQICQKGTKCPFRGSVNGGTVTHIDKPFCTGCDDKGENVWVKLGTEAAKLMERHGAILHPVEELSKTVKPLKKE